MRQGSTWKDIARQFEAKRDLFSMRLETGEEALGARLGEKWSDTGPRWDGLRPWLQIPFSKERDQELLDLSREAGRRLVDEIEAAIAQRKGGPSFVDQWGLFMFCAGVVEAAYAAQPADMHSERAAAARSRYLQKVWIAHALRHLGWTPGQNRGVFERIIFNHVLKLLSEKDMLEPPFDQPWYQGLLRKPVGRGSSLKSTFVAQGQFTDKEVVELWNAVADLPPLPSKPQF